MKVLFLFPLMPYIRASFLCRAPGEKVQSYMKGVEESGRTKNGQVRTSTSFTKEIIEGRIRGTYAPVYTSQAKPASTTFCKNTFCNTNQVVNYFLYTKTP